jgi:trk system potassium uptake protein TrkA
MEDTFVVIGLGRFGSALAEELCDLGHQVLAVDTNEKAVQRMADKVTQAVVADCQDPEVLEDLGVKNASCAVVAFSIDIGTSVLITLLLKELGIPQVVCKARNHSHAELLRRVGADQVVFPEYESGRNLARALDDREILSYTELWEGYGIIKTQVPTCWLGKSLAELEVGDRYHVNVITIQSADGAFQPIPDQTYLFRPGDTIFTLGDQKNNARVFALE